MGGQVFLPSEVDSVDQIEKEVQDGREWKEKEDSTKIRIEAGNRGELGLNLETACKSDGMGIRDQKPEQDTVTQESPMKLKERCNKMGGSEESRWNSDIMK